jgi:hypothetical protein
LEVGKDLVVLGLVFENLENGFLVSDTESFFAGPGAIGVGHEFEAHLIPHSFEVFIHFFINIHFGVGGKAMFEHGEHHASETSNGLSGGFGEEVLGAFLELHLVVGDESLVGGRHVDDILVVVGLLFDGDEDAGDFLGEVVFNKLVDDAHFVEYPFVILIFY